MRAYQQHLIAQKRSWSHINQTVCALRFFYSVTLSQGDALERIVAAREPQRLPVVLGPDEIVQFLEAVPGLRNRAALTTAYGAGLRVGEVARLGLVLSTAGPGCRGTTPARRRGRAAAVTRRRRARSDRLRGRADLPTEGGVEISKLLQPDLSSRRCSSLRPARPRELPT